MGVVRQLGYAACLVAMVQTAPAAARDAQHDAQYGELSLSVPSPQGLTVCHGFGCRDRTEIALSVPDRTRLTQLLGAGRASAAAERDAISAALVWFDRRVAPQAGTTGHVARAGLKQMDNPSTQYDCIDSSRNTTSLLLILDDMGLLKFHQVELPAARGALIDGRWPHATGVVSERTSGKKWAIDTWTRPFGERPEVMPLDLWLTLR
jgi:hypothetical protein